MKIIGLAGESGTGKTTIAKHLERRGAGHIDADRIAHDLLRDDPEVRRRIRARFGTAVFDGDDVDRSRLGEVVFEDPALLQALNSIIHPAIITACVEAVTRFADAGKRWVVIDAALLLEVPLPIRFDLMIGLQCGRSEQRRRLLARDSVDAAAVDARLERQAHIEKSFYRADVVIDTGRDKDEVLDEIDRLVDFLFAEDEAP